MSASANGWLVTLTPAPNQPPFNPSLIVGSPYTSTITFPIAFTNASQYVYGAPVGPGFLFGKRYPSDKHDQPDLCGGNVDDWRCVVGHQFWFLGWKLRD